MGKSPGKSPRKSPAKGSPKGKGAKDSPKGKKASPKKGEADGPPVNVEIQADQSTNCYLCRETFVDAAAIQAHMCLMDHTPPYSNKEQRCRACNALIKNFEVTNHKCCMNKANFFRFLSSHNAISDGAPYRCLYCRSKPMMSRVYLCLHLLCFHCPNKKPGRCGMCCFTYEEPPPPGPTPGLPPAPSPTNTDPKAMEEYKKECMRLEALQTCQPLNDASPVGLLDLDDHIKIEHLPSYELYSQVRINQESGERWPYTCPICGHNLKNNVDFHAHVIASHANNEPMVEDCFYNCAVCHATCGDTKALNCHIHTLHSEHLKILARRWTKHELMVNNTSPADTCITCWKKFKYDFELQAHIGVQHATLNVLRCGFCSADYSTCQDKVIGRIFKERHERNHARELQAVALEMGTTFVPLTDPEDDRVVDRQTWKEQEARLKAERDAAGSPGGKKSPGKKSPGKKSPGKSPKGGSPKGKGSPKKGKK